MSENDENRIASDANFAGLAVRVDSLERRVEVVEMEVRNNSRELVANTKITKQVHEAIFGREEEGDGIKGKVKEMHDVFTDGKRGLKMLNNLADAGARYGKPIMYLVLIGVAIATYMRTGDFKWPGWPS